MEKWLELSEDVREAHLELDDEWEDMIRREDEGARRRGFACASDERNFRIQEDEKRWNEYCARRGITREQLYEERAAAYAVDPQRFSLRPYLAGGLPSPCDCENHPDTFCPLALPTFRSQDLDASYFENLEAQHRVDFDQLSALQHGPSKRLTSPGLEMAWERESQRKNPNMPFWALWDNEVQQMMKDQRCEDDQQSSDTSSQTSWPDSVFTEDMEESEHPWADPTNGGAIRRTTFSEPGVKSELGGEIVEAIRSKSHSRSPKRSPSPVSRGRERQRSAGTFDKPSSTITAKIRKSQSVPARWTRAHKPLDLWELGSNGKPRRGSNT
ncbi:hypothetical protein MMC10_006406 [Thelotrema lepadinum]|nr:hypothetical protein [Thelotrema lepadinum]